MPSLSDISARLAGLVDTLGSEQFLKELADTLCWQTQADDATVIIYEQGELPGIAYAKPLEGAAETALNTYLTGPFLLDPFYRAAQHDNQFGVFRLVDLAPSGFRASEYYKTWYKSCGYQDECGLLIDLGDRSFINISMGLLAPQARFSRKQARDLQDLFPMIEAMCKKHWGGQLKSDDAISMRDRLHSSLGAFGSSVLTKRERQVIELVLLGHNTRLIAEKLGISIETVKLHRKHAYAKLDINSQAELFYLFMEALAHSSGDASIDPLIAYQGLG